MKCEKCGFENSENLKFCGNCGNKLVVHEPNQISKSELDPKRDPFAKNYKKIFNICFYPVIGWIVISILITVLFINPSPNGLFGSIMNIFFNFWIWLFLIFIFIFRKNHKVWALVLSIIFGCATILGASAPYVLPWLNN